MESEVLVEQLSEQARVGSPFCCLPDSITAVQNFPNNSGRGSYACSNQHAWNDEMQAKRSQRNYQQQQKWWKQRS